MAADPGRANDRRSASYLIALAARAIREVGDLWSTAREKNKRLATLSAAAEQGKWSTWVRGLFEEEPVTP